MVQPAQEALLLIFVSVALVNLASPQALLPSDQRTLEKVKTAVPIGYLRCQLSFGLNRWHPLITPNHPSYLEPYICAKGMENFYFGKRARQTTCEALGVSMAFPQGDEIIRNYLRGVDVDSFLGIDPRKSDDWKEKKRTKLLADGRAQLATFCHCFVYCVKDFVQEKADVRNVKELEMKNQFYMELREVMKCAELEQEQAPTGYKIENTATYQTMKKIVEGSTVTDSKSR